jgi:hypothetical protein
MPKPKIKVFDQNDHWLYKLKLEETTLYFSENKLEESSQERQLLLNKLLKALDGRTN